MLSEKRKKNKTILPIKAKQKKTNDITKRNQKEKKILTKKQSNQLINAIDKQSKRESDRENAGENQTLLNQRHLDLYRAVVSWEVL